MTGNMTTRRHLFSERLNHILSEADFPRLASERAADFAKVFDLDVISAERIIDGLMFPAEALLARIAEEFEVSPAWLSGL